MLVSAVVIAGLRHVGLSLAMRSRRGEGRPRSGPHRRRRRNDRRPASPLRPSITIFTRSYPPAYLTGGPARSLFALVETLTDDFGFSVITSALDDPAAGPMGSVEPNQWSAFGNAKTWYELKGRLPARRTAALLRETKPRLVYLNSLFDYRFAILPLLISRVISKRLPVILAPRGELSAGALALSRRKKHFFIVLFRLLGLHKTVSWHASTSHEKADIERMFGVGVRIHVAIALRIGISGECADRDYLPPSDPHSCSLVFFARIVPKKNVATAIRAMALVKGNRRLSVAGPIEDEKYWAQCLKLIDDLDDPEMIRYVGAIPPDDVVSFLGGFDLFVFPTHGENFGHTVLESLAAGTPVIVGHATPWRQIETAGAGWMCDPTSPEEVASLIQRFMALDAESRMRMRTAARGVATEVLNDPKGVDANRAMFRALISGGLAGHAAVFPAGTFASSGACREFRARVSRARRGWPAGPC